MSNYPPGVTGHEYAIAGPSSERGEEREVGECAKFERMRIVYVTKRGVQDNIYRTTTIRRVQGIPCTFAGGEVEGVTSDHAWFDWTCPSCGFENTMEVEPPEPDDEYYPDRYFD